MATHENNYNRNLEETSNTGITEEFMNMISRGLGGCICDACVLCLSGATSFCAQCPCCGGGRRLRQGPVLTRELQQDLNRYARKLCYDANIPCVDCNGATVIEI